MAEEAVTTAGVSEDNQDPAGAGETGVSGDGGAGATSTATGDAFAAERERMESVQRKLQGERDAERARAAKLEQELTAAKGGVTEDKPLSVADITRLLDDRDRARELRTAADTFRSSDDFKYADKSIFDRADSFDSPEALKAALQQSHDSVKAVVDSETEVQVKAQVEAVLKEAGIAVKPAPSAAPPNPSGLPSIEEVNSTPMSEWDARGWTPEVIDKVIYGDATVTS